MVGIKKHSINFRWVFEGAKSPMLLEGHSAINTKYGLHEMLAYSYAYKYGLSGGVKDIKVVYLHFGIIHQTIYY